MEQWANGNYTTEDIYGTIQLNSEAIGKAEVLKDLCELEWDQIERDLYEPL